MVYVVNFLVVRPIKKITLFYGKSLQGYAIHEGVNETVSCFRKRLINEAGSHVPCIRVHTTWGSIIPFPVLEKDWKTRPEVTYRVIEFTPRGGQ